MRREKDGSVRILATHFRRAEDGVSDDDDDDGTLDRRYRADHVFIFGLWFLDDRGGGEPCLAEGGSKGRFLVRDIEDGILDRSRLSATSSQTAQAPLVPDAQDLPISSRR